ncbi:MAG TPA: alanine racemase, partial [Bacteroidales bacterium]|nr:alanine racemase [Bacteroidales bacterium]
MSANLFTHLEISIPNIRYNLNYFRSFLNKKTKLLVLVKAYGYGHGIGEFSRILEENGVDYLAVAF